MTVAVNDVSDRRVIVLHFDRGKSRLWREVSAVAGLSVIPRRVDAQKERVGTQIVQRFRSDGPCNAQEAHVAVSLKVAYEVFDNV